MWSDFNDDGRPDLFVANDPTPNYLYRNDGKGHFSNVSLESGTAVSSDGGELAGMGVAACDYNHSGRFSIHVTNFEDQYNSLYRNEAVRCSPTCPTFLGLGAAQKVDRIEIRWPSGATETLRDIAGGRFYAVKEAHGIVSADDMWTK